MNSDNHFIQLKTREKERRKQCILDAAVTMFAEKPFSQVTMRAIADAVGITPAAIYSYFPDKNDLFAEAYRAVGDVFIREVSEMIEDCEDFCIEAVAEKYISHFYGTGRPLNIMMQFMLDESITTSLWEKINSTNRQFTGLIEDFFKTASKNTDAKILAQSFIAALNGILLTAKNYPKKTEEEILAHMKDLSRVIAGMFRKEIG